jgi:hypothetical protein
MIEGVSLGCRTVPALAPDKCSVERLCPTRKMLLEQACNVVASPATVSIVSSAVVPASMIGLRRLTSAGVIKHRGGFESPVECGHSPSGAKPFFTGAAR